MNDGKHVTDTYHEQTSSIASPIQTTTQAPGLDDTQQTNPIYSAKFFQDPQSIGPGFDLSDRGAQADVLDLTSRSYLKSGQ